MFVDQMVYLNVKIYILINGSSVGFFYSLRGLRQGDPLSTHHFVIVMEAPNRMISALVLHGYMSGFSIGDSS